MLVIVVENAPPALRGRLTLWLTEIDTGVYVGTYSQNLHRRIWADTKELIGDGRALSVWPTRTREEGFSVERIGDHTPKAGGTEHVA